MIGVLIVASIRLYREGLAFFLHNCAGITVVGTARDRCDVIVQLAAVHPAVVLVDLATDDSDAIVRDIIRLAPALPIVALGISDREQDVMTCIEAGVAGFVSREGTRDDLANAIESAARGDLQCTPQLAGRLLRRVASLASRQPAVPAESRLTGREWEIVRLIEQNFSNKEIATRLGIEVATVKNHVHNLLDKLHMRKRAEVVRWLMRLGDSSAAVAPTSRR